MKKYRIQHDITEESYLKQGNKANDNIKANMSIELSEMLFSDDTMNINANTHEDTITFSSDVYLTNKSEIRKMLSYVSKLRDSTSFSEQHYLDYLTTFLIG